MKHILYYLIAGTRGGPIRLRILEFLHKTPSNANQIAEALKLDYKTVKHHLTLFQKYNLLSKEGGYGAVYFLKDFVADELPELRKKIG